MEAQISVQLWREITRLILKMMHFDFFCIKQRNVNNSICIAIQHLLIRDADGGNHGNCEQSNEPTNNIVVPESDMHSLSQAIVDCRLLPQLRRIDKWKARL
jgi:hypothetical protein